jgi:uncharacterized protein
LTETTDVFEAIEAGDLERMQRLVSVNPALAAARDTQGVSAVTQAVYHGHADIVDALLAVQIDLDVFEASALGRTDDVRTLVTREPDLVFRFSPDGFTPLHLAAFFGHVDIARLLIDLGADVEAVARNRMRVRPLHSAAASRQLEIARLLVDAGADVNERQEHGFTPLHAAAQNGDLDLTRMLLECGADAKQATEDGRLAADFARNAGNESVLDVLGKAASG